jgi:serine/threonine protein kinase
MGTAGFTEVIKRNSLSRNDFTFHYAIGRGGFGKVWVVTFQSDSQFYAMKEMLKLRIISKQSVNSVINEEKLLSILRHPFLVNMKFAFQDRDNLFLVMDLMKGGDLRYHLNLKERFSEEQTKFFAACIITGLEYLHVNNIIHRDIKPENLVLDTKGYLRITDFGIARVLTTDNSKDTSGTPGYMAPEVLNRQRHGFAVDYFALGVIVYEFMMGRRPYVGKNRKEIKEYIMARQARLVKSQVPNGWSLEAVDFVNKLIVRKPEDRLGFGGPHEVKSHVWIRDFNWKNLMEKKIESPFVPEEDENFDPRVLVGWKDDLDYSIDPSTIQPLFRNYYFDWRESKNKPNETTLKAKLEDFINK